MKIVKWNLRDLEAVLNRALRAVATLGIFGAKVTGIADALIWSRPNAIRDVDK